MKLDFLNTKIDNLSMNETIDIIDNIVSTNENQYITFINVDVVVKIEEDAELRKIVNNAYVNLIDGKPLVWIGKFLKIPNLTKISGSDLVPKILELAANKGYSIFLIGGKQNNLNDAIINIKKIYKNINICGSYSPKVGFENDKNEINFINNKIKELNANIVIACLGCPKQEKWIYNNMNKYKANVSICAGATIDFLSLHIKRAPKWMQDSGLEWFYRFINEPKRLFKRYFIDDMKVFSIVFKYLLVNSKSLKK